ncbi:GNAT family N-acetyltransferase [Kribbella sp. NPDC026611]|uniref:GNAT family N-acetyltransferase n=1 Tax=Kribbella sp. NPDC026611 TaxID=3154911 RepID=UPI0033FF6F2E
MADLYTVTTPEVRFLDAQQARDQTVVDELVHLVNGAYAVGEAGLWRDGATRTVPAEMADAIGSGGVLAATLGGRLVGCAYVRPLDADTADLGLVSAAPQLWGKGIGGELVRTAEQLMGERGTTIMQLEVLVPTTREHEGKRRLRAWYTHLGYQVVRTEPFEHVAAHLQPQLATPCQFLIFHKPLTPNRHRN